MRPRHTINRTSRTHGAGGRSAEASRRKRQMCLERETGLEPATFSLEDVALGIEVTHRVCVIRSSPAVDQASIQPILVLIYGWRSSVETGMQGLARPSMTAF
jgi:hypothetical protein